MKRREFFIKAGMATIASLTNFPLGKSGRIQANPGIAETSHNQDITKVSTKPFLFFDLWKLDYIDNCELKQGNVKFVPEATYVDNSVPGQGAGKPNVFFDKQNKVWRMLYNIGWAPVGLMSAISNDGINWVPDPHPDIKIPPETGKRIADHHIFQLNNSAAGGFYQDPVAKDGFPYKMFIQLSGKPVYKRALDNPRHPLHSMAQKVKNRRLFHEGRMLVSRDGLHWKLHPEYFWARPDWHPEPPYFGFYNRNTKKHSMIVRPGWGDRRVGIQSTENFQSWSDPELLLQMDPLDKHPVGFYTMPVIPYGHMYVGLLWVFHNSSSKPVQSFNQFYGTMDAQLTYSYDGIRFFRGLREPIIPLNSHPKHGSTQLRPYSIIEHEDEIRIYSGASRAPHGLEGTLQKAVQNTNSIVLHKLRKDGWVYLRPYGHWARIQTKPLGIWSSEILLNAAAPYGIVRYQITNEESKPIEGFSFDDCIPLKYQDKMNWSMQWKNGKISDLAGKVIRIEIEFYNANIYSLKAAYHMLDAQDKLLMEEGQKINPSRFDF